MTQAPAPASSPAARTVRRPRALIAVLCAQLLLSACHATGVSPTGAVWPEPMPQPPEPTRTASPWPTNAVTRTMPNFQAPSATHCARPIQTREVPGFDPQQPTSNPMRGHLADSRTERLRETHSKRADAGVALERADAMPAPPPAAVAASPIARDAEPASILPLPPRQRPAPAQALPVTAGMVDDNADFGEYLRFRERTQVAHRARDVRERYLLQVRNARGTVVPDAEVAVTAPSGATLWARTDAGGRAWLHPDAVDTTRSAIYEVAVRKDGREASTFLRRGQKSAVDVVLADSAAPTRARLDLVFLIDATGSMADEIGRLKTTLRSIANEVAQLPSRPDTCFGLVAYRDKGDEFLLRSHDFTNDLGAFQGVLNALQANGGGDYPEAMNEALHDTVHRLSWRGSGATRMVVLLADAPPHLDYGGPQYDDDMLAALGKGIKIFSVGASGLDKQGEVVQRQMAQYTGGRFVFLTYKDAERPASGPGRETVHDVSNYSVQTLDRLIVRLVTEELAQLPKGG
ncbi:vWA domain-containing protein [Variovorax arabinosiphilus]|uniref:vWA domain-containing protein n=1 Tax=Variovorax arabinosiphilus TaxID=3053498 RepID=UPI0025767DA8|nr:MULTISPECIES: VWA domain-containing protein [unclassified Variovorax]MDM0120851.1 VWA domain-containing protein [Variovorax sp. J2L1-78]MDM0127237.1 VWA domain-containing protein [Variovorax sp. J2L1-63]MDM0236231.1 VWA domain-containing protein [Variovorax sp. J2R1-6]